MKSDSMKVGLDKAAHRSLLKALGWTDEEIKMPIAKKPAIKQGSASKQKKKK